MCCGARQRFQQLREREKALVIEHLERSRGKSISEFRDLEQASAPGPLFRGLPGRVAPASVCLLPRVGCRPLQQVGFWPSQTGGRYGGEVAVSSVLPQDGAVVP
jgi:hypothetical protein